MADWQPAMLAEFKTWYVARWQIHGDINGLVYIHYGFNYGFNIHSRNPRNMAMDQYLLIPFLGEWTSIYQLFWCSPGVQGFDPSPYLFVYYCFIVEMGWFMMIYILFNGLVYIYIFTVKCEKKAPCLHNGKIPMVSIGFLCRCFPRILFSQWEIHWGIE